MTILLDTHILYWWITQERPLSETHRTPIKSSETVFVSAVTGWEIAIKVKLGKWPDAAAILPDLEAEIVNEGFSVLNLTLTQAKSAGLLNLAHRDPFDRILAAQALDLDIPILTVDKAFNALGCKTV